MKTAKGKRYFSGEKQVKARASRESNCTKGAGKAEGEGKGP